MSYYNTWTKINDPIPKQQKVVSEVEVNPISPSKTQKLVDEINSRWLMRIPNLSYQKYSGTKDDLIRLGVEYRTHEFMAKSAFFSKIDDGESKQRAIYDKTYKENPEFILSRTNDKKEEEEILKPNSINKPVMTDPGHAEFPYEQTDKDQIGLIQDSNSAYLKARDKLYAPTRREDVANRRPINLEITNETIDQLIERFADEQSFG